MVVLYDALAVFFVITRVTAVYVTLSKPIKRLDRGLNITNYLKLHK
jgi:hypothetical protein